MTQAAAARFKIIARIGGVKEAGHLINAADLSELALEAAAQPCMITAKHIVGEVRDVIEIKIAYHPKG